MSKMLNDSFCVGAIVALLLAGGPSVSRGEEIDVFANLEPALAYVDLTHSMEALQVRLDGRNLTILSAWLCQNPGEIAPIGAAFRVLRAQTHDQLKDLRLEIARTLAETVPTSALREVVAFHSSPLGQRWIAYRAGHGDITQGDAKRAQEFEASPAADAVLRAAEKFASASIEADTNVFGPATQRFEEQLVQQGLTAPAEWDDACPDMGEEMTVGQKLLEGVL